MNLQPTYTGYVANTHDALILFQATITGRLPAVSRRPHDRERTELVRSGAVFIFNEQTSGIKRWTDGIAWSPSRILGNFLVYRQLEKPFTPGEKKQTNKRSRRNKQRASGGATSPYSSSRVSPGGTDDEIKYMSSGGAPGSVTGSSLPIQIDLPNQTPGLNGMDPNSAPVERSLVGSLVDSYGFKKDGLIKKTMSIIVDGQPHHLVSYYKPEDVLSGVFETPSNSAFLKDLVISEELTQRQNFRVPLDSNNPASGTTNGMDMMSHSAPQQRMIQPLQGSYMAGAAANGAYSELGYDVDVSNFASDPSGQRIKSSPSSPAYYRNGQPLNAAQANSSGNGYMAGYRPYGATQQQQQQQQQQQYLQQQATAVAGHEYYPNLPPPQTPYPQYTAKSTTQAGGPGGNSASTAVTASSGGYSPSLPPLAAQQQQSYSYQSYPHEYHVSDAATVAAVAASAGSSSSTSGISDPRRLPDTSAQGYSPQQGSQQQPQVSHQQQQHVQHQQQQHQQMHGQQQQHGLQQQIPGAQQQPQMQQQQIQQPQVQPQPGLGGAGGANQAGHVPANYSYNYAAGYNNGQW